MVGNTAAGNLAIRYNGPATNVLTEADEIVIPILRACVSRLDHPFAEGAELPSQVVVTIRQG